MSRVVEFKKIVLRGFGLYADEAVFEFRPGINTYLGPNESGKSTLAAGIAAVLFGLVQSSDKDSFSIERYKNWGDPTRFEGEIEFSSVNRQWHIKRSFSDNSIVVKWRNDESTWQELLRGTHNPRASKPNVAYLNFLKDYLGVDNLNLFRQTFFVEQPLPQGARLESKVQELLSGGGAHYQKVLSTLVSNLKELTMNWSTYCHSLGSGRVERRLDAIKRNRQELEQKLLSEGREADELLSVKEQLVVLQKQRAELVQQLRTYQNIRAAFSSWQISRDRYELERSRASTLQTAKKQAEKLEAELAQHRCGLDQQDIELSMQQKLQSNISTFSAKHGVEPKTLPQDVPVVIERHISLLANEERLSARLKAVQTKTTRTYWPLGIGVLLALVAIIMRGGLAGYAIALLTCSVGLALSLFVRKEHPSAKVYSEELSEISTQIRTLEKTYPFLSGRDVGELRMLKQDILSYREFSAETERAIKEQKLNGQVIIREKEAALRQILMQCKVGSVEELNNAVEKQQDGVYFALREWRNLINANPGLPSPDEDITAVTRSFQKIEQAEEHCQSQVSALEERLFALRQKQGELEGKLLYSIAQGEEVARELADEETMLTTRAKAVGLAIQELEAAAQEFQTSYRQRLEQIATEHFARITNSSRQVVVDEEFSIMVRTPEGLLITPNQLSQGTQDQLYLALRLSIADLTAHHVGPPLIFDDPFLTSDEERLDNLRQALHNIGRQCLLLSHSERFAEWGT